MEALLEILETKTELKRMKRGNLFKLVMDQKLSNCLVGGGVCGYSIDYKGVRFCVSELLGKGCLVERLGQWEKFYPDKEKINDSLPLLRDMGPELSLPGKSPIEFKVYYRDDLTRSIVYLGKVIERRRKERGDNLRDLLKKAIKEYSNYVRDSSQLFLLGCQDGNPLTGS
jgi:hypothetical protein